MERDVREGAGVEECGHICYSGSELADNRGLGLDTGRNGNAQTRRSVKVFANKSQSWSAGITNIDGVGDIRDRERSREAVSVHHATHSESVELMVSWVCILLVVACPMRLPKIPSSIVPIKKGR